MQIDARFQVPPKITGRVTQIAPAGNYKLTDTVMEVHLELTGLCASLKKMISKYAIQE